LLIDEAMGLKAVDRVIQIDEARIRDHLGEMVRGGGCATKVHRRHNMVGQMLYEHATTLSAAPKPKPLHDRMCERFWTLPRCWALKRPDQGAHYHNSVTIAITLADE